MNKLVIVPHKDIYPKLLYAICEIKKSAWPYDLEEHKKWILENINDSDFHILLKVNGQYKAYLNLVHIYISDKAGNKFKSFGIGNVCSASKGKGLGRALMKLTNNYIRKENNIGVLFCKKELISFYIQFNYKVYNEVEKGVFLMAFNYNSDYINYEGPRF